MRQAISNYVGPHDVILRRTDRNLGLVPHFFNAAKLAEGRLIIAAGGDDISYSHRVRRLVEAWLSTGADGLTSGWNVIDTEGNLLKSGSHGGSTDLRFHCYFPEQRFTPLIGASAAYSSEALRRIPEPPPSVYAEDLYIALMLHWRRRLVVSLPEPLVAYRQHQSALTHKVVDPLDVVSQEQLVERQSAKMAEVLAFFAETVARGAPPDHWGAPTLVNRRAVAEDIIFNRFRSSWIAAPMFDRLCAIARFRDIHHRRWLLPRVFGLDALRLLKSLSLRRRLARSGD
jgi:cellulose synthase/poly-beta-1,6-N-acetylglucosamine synthase-like glycosyltransferase